MGLCLGRITVLENQSGLQVQLRECLPSDGDGTSSPMTVVNPESRKLIPATKYHRDSMDSGLPRSIKIYWKNACHGIYTPEDFIINVKFIFHVHNDRLLITPSPRQNQYYIKSLACFHGEYSGRGPMEEEATSERGEVIPA